MIRISRLVRTGLTIRAKEPCQRLLSAGEAGTAKTASDRQPRTQGASIPDGWPTQGLTWAGMGQAPQQGLRQTGAQSCGGGQRLGWSRLTILCACASRAATSCGAPVALLACATSPQQQGTDELQSLQLDVQSTAEACHACCGAHLAAVCSSLCSNGAAEGHSELPTPAACFPFATRSPRLSKHGSGGADLIWRMDGAEQQQAHSTGNPVLRSISLVSAVLHMGCTSMLKDRL